ncbi:MAG: phosphonomutase [Rhodobacterales bacterium]|nr:MAG: phosphonomutase [Rhodobacterales bacterium]
MSFAAFNALHKPGDPLVLFNIWDTASAQAVSAAGAKALATGSWSVAAAHGYEDTQALPLDLHLTIVSRIAATCALPLTVDFEAGYASSAEQIAANVTRLKATGAVGMNFEDTIHFAPGLTDAADQCARIKAIRAATGPEFFINARTDVFLESPEPDTHAQLLPQAIDRAAAYADHGASGLFLPGLKDPDLIAKACEALPLPVNVLAYPDGPDRATLASCGVARISHGPFPMRAMLDTLQTVAHTALHG